MNLGQWSAVDRYIDEQLVHSDSALDAVLKSAQRAGLDPIHVSPNQGKFLYLLAHAVGARRILEIGTLAGYSTIWMARALAPSDRLITLEIDPHHAELARANFAGAGLADRIELRFGPALETLPNLAAENQPPFDFVFIDADKWPAAEYFDWALRMSRVGTIIIVDNVVRNGAVVDASSIDRSVQGVRRCIDRMAAEPRVSATILQTVGSKGYDGFSLALVVG